MCGYFCIAFIDFLLKAKIFLDYTHFLRRRFFLLFAVSARMKMKKYLKKKKN